MEKVKMRYVAQIEITDEEEYDDATMFPFEDIQKNIRENFTEQLRVLLHDEIVPFGHGNVVVTEQFADAWMVEE